MHRSLALLMAAGVLVACGDVEETTEERATRLAAEYIDIYNRDTEWVCGCFADDNGFDSRASCEDSYKISAVARACLLALVQEEPAVFGSYFECQNEVARVTLACQQPLACGDEAAIEACWDDDYTRYLRCPMLGGDMEYRYEQCFYL